MRFYFLESNLDNAFWNENGVILYTLVLSHKYSKMFISGTVKPH